MSVIIRLQGLPLSAGISEVRSFFSGLRIPDGAVHIVGGTEGDVFVGFASDEDARQAMLNSGLLIHGSKIRLLLSSRTEMNSVIQQARAAAMGGMAAMSAPAPTPVAPKPAPETPRYEAAYARAEPPVYKQTNTPVNPSTQSGGYTGWGQRAAPVEEPTPPVKPDPIPSASEPVFPPIYKRDYASANQSDRDAPSQRYDSGPRRDPLLDAAIAPHVDASAHHPHANEREREHTRADQSYNGAKWTMDDMRWPDDTAGMRSVNMNQRPAEGSAYNERPRYDEVRGGRNGHENGGRQDDGYFSKLAPSAERYDAKREAPIYTQERENNPHHPATQAAYEPSPQQGFFNKPVSVPQKPYELPPSSSDNGARQFFPTAPAQPCKPIPPPPMPVYVELSRLPPDLMRPANLELFIRPKTPLTLTSLKVVYGVGGLHLYTLVRLANESDALTLLARDGERGVRVMRSNKKAFDEANDGLGALPPVVPNLKMQSQMPRRIDREREERDHRRRRSRSRSPLRGRGGGGEKRWRGARRSRSPRRSPRRSRSPRHSQPDDPHRHCVVMTNLPYKISDKEIKDWLAGSELTPTSLRRSFYEDGQASDRWIVEFDSPALVDRLYEHRQRISDRLARFLRLRRVSNREADELLAIPDKFGEERKKETESQLLKDAGLIEPLKFGAFSTPVFSGTGQHNRTDRGGYMDDAPAPPPAMKPQPPGPVPTPLMAAGARPPPMPLLDAVVSYFGGRGGGRGGAAMPRGALAMRGGMGAPRRGGLLGTSNGGGINPLGGPLTCVVLKNAPDDNLEVMCLVDAGQGAVLEKASDGTVYVELGSVEAAAAVTRKHGQLVRGRPLHVACMSRAQMDFELRQGGGGGGGAAPSGRADADRQLASDLAQFGCVLTCDGFPPQTTLEDILHFFADVPVARDTIRMRMNDVGVPTGECMLAVRGQSAAERAVRSLSGRTFHGSSIRVRIAQ